MANDNTRKLDHVETASTARIDRRQTILAQIEAALLADKLSVMDIDEESSGNDPYNSARVRTAWNKQAR